MIKEKCKNCLYSRCLPLNRINCRLKMGEWHDVDENSICPSYKPDKSVERKD
jgi:hypothetical protein